MLADAGRVGHWSAPSLIGSLPPTHHSRFGRIARRAAALGPLVLLAACAKQSAAGVAADAPGFLLGVWHGFIFPAAWVISLFMPDVAVYAVPNNGGWYDFGFFVGVVFLGVGARKSRVVYRDRWVRR